MHLEEACPDLIGNGLEVNRHTPDLPEDNEAETEDIHVQGNLKGGGDSEKQGWRAAQGGGGIVGTKGRWIDEGGPRESAAGEAGCKEGHERNSRRESLLGAEEKQGSGKVSRRDNGGVRTVAGEDAKAANGLCRVLWCFGPE